MNLDQAMSLALDARDAVHKARRAAKFLKLFSPELYQRLSEIEDSVTVAINDQLALRNQEVKAERRAA